MKQFIVALLVLCIWSCKEDPVPKPKAYLRLQYPEADYKVYNKQLPFTFEKNELATKITKKSVSGKGDGFGLTIDYPSLKGSIYLTYKPVKDANNLTEYLRDAQNFTQEHTRVADEITDQPFENKKHKVYGMFYEVGGNAASQSQFYVTDSTRHFLTGSLYFYAKPNYDSILPAAHYMRNDIRRLMESIEWD